MLALGGERKRTRFYSIRPGATPSSSPPGATVRCVVAVQSKRTDRTTLNKTGDQMRKALSGLSVVELGGGIPPAYCGKLFGDLGADVVKVEPPGGDELRHSEGTSLDGKGLCRDGLVLHLHTNKRSVAMDPRDAESRDTVTRLVDGADLVIESRGHGTLADWGIEWEELHRRQPAVSVVHISGFGATGPYADYRWDDIVVQAVSGAFLLQGYPGLTPVKLPAHVAFYFVGHMAAVGAVSALLATEAGQEGSFVDCSAVEALAAEFPPAKPHFSVISTGRGSRPPTSTLLPPP